MIRKNLHTLLQVKNQPNKPNQTKTGTCHIRTSITVIVIIFQDVVLEQKG